MLKEKSCGALVISRQDDGLMLLILKHRLGGHWAFPKGHVENDESERETAVREVLEETGLSIKLQSGYRRRVFYSPKKGIKKEVVYFLGYAEDYNATPQEEEISEIRWVPLDEGHKYLTFRNDRSLLRDARWHIKEKGIKEN